MRKKKGKRNILLVIIAVVVFGVISMLFVQPFTFAPSQSDVTCSQSANAVSCTITARQAGGYYADYSRTRVRFDGMSATEVQEWISKHPCTAIAKGTDKVTREKYEQITSAKLLIDKLPLMALKFYSPRQGTAIITVSCKEREKICTPGDLNCYEDTSVVKCSEDGTAWQIIETCKYRCSEGACNPPPQECNPEEVKCVGDNVIMCAVTGTSWITQEVCDYGCENAVCNLAPEVTEEEEMITPEGEIEEEVIVEVAEEVQSEDVIAKEMSIWQRIWFWILMLFGRA